MENRSLSQLSILYSILTNLNSQLSLAKNQLTHFLFQALDTLNWHSSSQESQLLTMTVLNTLLSLSFSLFRAPLSTRNSLFTLPYKSLDLGQGPATIFSKEADALHKLSLTQLTLLTQSKLTLSIFYSQEKLDVNNTHNGTPTQLKTALHPSLSPLSLSLSLSLSHNQDATWACPRGFSYFLTRRRKSQFSFTLVVRTCKVQLQPPHPSVYSNCQEVSRAHPAAPL